MGKYYPPDCSYDGFTYDDYIAISKQRTTEFAYTEAIRTAEIAIEMEPERYDGWYAKYNGQKAANMIDPHDMPTSACNETWHKVQELASPEAKEMFRRDAEMRERQIQARYKQAANMKKVCWLIIAVIAVMAVRTLMQYY